MSPFARRARRWPLPASVVVALAVIASCSSGSGAKLSLPSSPVAPTPTTAAAAPAGPVPDCGNPRASFAPTGPLPGPDALPTGSYMAKIRQSGRLRVAVSADTLLFGFSDPVDGQLKGFDIDVARQVANAIFGDPNKIEFRVVTYAQRIPALKAGDVDLVADVMTINCTRWAQISFSSEYFTAGQKILVRKDSPVTDISALAGRQVCAAKGSTNIEELKKYPKVKVVPVDDISDCMVVFQQGGTDAVTGDDTVLAGFVAQDPYAKVVGPAITDEPYGLGIAKQNTDFVRFVNAVLDKIRTDGTWKRLYTQNGLGTPPEPPAPIYGRAS